MGIDGKEDIRVVREGLQSLMEQNVGVFRNEEVLSTALSGIDSLWKRQESIRPETPEEYRALRELRNMLRVARVISTGALNRQESRGGHNRVDFNETKEEFRKHTLARIGADETVTLTYKTVCT